MSIWYSYDLTGFGDKAAIAKFFNLTEEDVRVWSFEFSFSRKNIPGLNLDQIILQNPNLIFLCHEGSDYGGCHWLQRGKDGITLEKYSYDEERISKVNPAFKKPDLGDYSWPRYFHQMDLIDLQTMMNNHEKYKMPNESSPILGGDDFGQESPLIEDDIAFINADDK